MQKIVYITQFVTNECLKRRNNLRHLSAAANNKSLGLTMLCFKAGYDIIILSPGLSNNKTRHLHKAFEEEYNQISVHHASEWDIPGLHVITSILSQCKWLYKYRSSFQKILFYNYRPETCMPAFFAHIVLRKKIYLEYEDGFFALKINKILKIVIRAMELIGNRFISGAILVNDDLAPRVRTSNTQTISGLIDKEMQQHFQSLPKRQESQKIFMYAGSLDEIRGVDIFLHLAEKLILAGHDNCQFWISGKGSLEEVVNHFSRKYPDRIKFYGFISREDLLKLYEEVDAFLSLQKPENQFSAASFPSKIFEYLSTGKMVIGTDYSKNLSSVDDIYSDMVDVIKTGQIKRAVSYPQLVENITIFDQKKI